MDYLEHMRLRLEGEESYVPARLGDKDQVRNFGRLVGIRVPATYYRGTLAGLPDELPSPFVLKPEFASTSQGLHILEVVEGGQYRSLVTGEILDRPTILEDCTKVSLRYFSEDEVSKAVFVAEEALLGHDGECPPPDIRVFGFQGDIGLIISEYHFGDKTRSMYFDGNFHPFQDLDDRYGLDARILHLEEMVPADTPANASKLLAVARRISQAVPSAFCRIDLYDTPAGIYLGELSLFPGTFYYRNRKLMSVKESKRLGALWDAAFDNLEGTVNHTVTKDEIRL